MSNHVALCIDEATRWNPASIGLDGENLGAQKWLTVFNEGAEAREALERDPGIDEAWVVSCDDVEPINLAASLKSDHPEMRVLLVSSDCHGSLCSRAHNALIDGVVTYEGLLECYVGAKARADGRDRDVADAAPSTARVNSGIELEPRERASHGGAHSAGASSRVLGPPAWAAVATAQKAQSRCFLMPVVSGAGGCGKSTVSVVAAYVASSMGYRTLLLDYDLQFGDVSVLAGTPDALTVDEAMRYPEKLERELGKDTPITVLAAPKRLEDSETVVRNLPGFLDFVSAEFEVIIANTGGAWAEQHAALLERCSTALFLVDQRLSSIRACRHALDLCARCGIATGQFQYAVNRCFKGSPLTSIDVSCALQGVSVFELKDGGPEVEESLNGGAASDLVVSGNEFVKSVSVMMERILPGGDKNPKATQDAKVDVRSVRKRGRHAHRRRGR